MGVLEAAIGALVVAFGVWVVRHPKVMADFISSSQRDAGRGAWQQDEFLPRKTEWGFLAYPGDRARSMVAVGAGDIVVGLVMIVMGVLKIIG